MAGATEIRPKQGSRVCMALVLSRKLDEAIYVGDDVKITIIDIRGDKIRLAIDAPHSTRVDRAEVRERILRGAPKLPYHSVGRVNWPDTNLDGLLVRLHRQKSSHLEVEILPQPGLDTLNVQAGSQYELPETSFVLDQEATAAHPVAHGQEEYQEEATTPDSQPTGGPCPSGSD